MICRRLRHSFSAAPARYAITLPLLAAADAPAATLCAMMRPPYFHDAFTIRHFASCAAMSFCFAAAAAVFTIAAFRCYAITSATRLF
jgi:hypothetical protein